MVLCVAAMLVLSWLKIEQLVLVMLALIKIWMEFLL